MEHRFEIPFRKSLRSCGWVLALMALLASPAGAQEAVESGRLIGQVVSAQAGTPLPGARVQIENVQRSTMAGVEGRYRIDGVPAGEAAIEVTMLGYAPKRVTGIQITPGELVQMDVQLAPRALELGAVVVTAQQERGSSVSLLNEQRHASSLVSGLSAEQIGRSPDGDAAAAARRVSGVTVQDGQYVFVRGLGERYTTSSLNGSRMPSPDPERKMVPLDLFPAGLLQSISTNKTFTPDQPGDFSGGSVDLRTPDFPARRTYSLSASTGYHFDLTGRPMTAAPVVGREWLAFGAASRTIPDPARSFSGLVTRGPEVNGVVNSFRNAWSPQERSGLPPVSLSGSLGGSHEILGMTVGYLGSLTYSAGDEGKLAQRRARVGTGETEIDRYDGEEGASSVLWGGLWNTSALFGSHSQIDLNNTFSRSASNQARSEAGTDENTRSNVRIDRLTYVERSARSHQLRARHQVGRQHLVSWGVGRSSVSRAEPDRSEFVTWLDPDVPIWFKDFEGAVRTYSSVEEGAWDGNVGYAFEFGGRAGADPHRVRTGASYRAAKRDAWTEAFRVQAFDWSPDDPRWQLEPEEIFDGRFAEEDDELFLLSRELSGGTYGAHDHLYAGFLMLEMGLTDRIGLVGGARVESYELDVDAQNQLGRSFAIGDSYVDVLPSVAAMIEMGGDHQLRLSATRTLARPEYREIAPIAYREVLGGEQVIGNADLSRTRINNLDARWEWYPRPGETISIALFGKWFDAPIEQRFLARSGTNTRTFVNAEGAVNHGLELELDRRLDWIHPVLSRLSFFGNLTLMRSRVDTGVEGDAVRAMTQQAPYVVNSGLTYANPSRGLSATVLYNVVGKRIVNARASGSQVSDVIELPRGGLDLSVRFPVWGTASGKIDLKNLLDSPYEVVQGSTVREFHRTGRTLSVGLSWQP